MWILAYFTSAGVPAVGLFPTIRIRNLATDALVVTDAAMAKVGDGWYKYWFAAYDSTIDYAIRCDGTAVLANADRYAFGGSEFNGIDDIKGTAFVKDTDSLVNIRAFVDELEPRLTAARAAFLDNLSGGPVALEATLTAIRGAGWTIETLKLIKELIDELESGEKPPARARIKA